MRTATNDNSIPAFAALMVSSLFLSACGMTPYTEGGSSSRGFKLAATEEVQVPDSTITTVTDTDSAGTSATGSPTIMTRVGGYGYDAAPTVEVRTNRVLKVRFTPGIADENELNTGFTRHYSGLAVYIQVGATELPTPLLHNGVAGTAVETKTFDFSNSFERTCLRTDTSCRQMVTITVKKPNYDHYSFTYPYSGFPGWTHVTSTHPWNGTLTIQTDDTNAI